tara:strand:- start:147 stop:755 length:609 start_codon:yes stop_codon:yes gene_type:complete
MSLYSDADAFGLYTYYVAVKQHFTSDYDFFKYGGKLRLKQTSFDTRKDKFFFYKLTKKEDAKKRILANLLHNPKVWIGDIADSEKCEQVYTDWLTRQQRLRYSFKSDLSELDDDFDTEFKVVGGQHPHVLKLYLQKRVGIETLVILDDLLGCFKYWDKKVRDNIVYPNINNSVSNYRPFLYEESFELDKFKKILLDKYENIL